MIAKLVQFNTLDVYTTRHLLLKIGVILPLFVSVLWWDVANWAMKTKCILKHLLPNTC